MTYEEAKVYIEEVSRTGSILGLESIQNLMAELGDVQEQLNIIHIGGTNGKGSTGAFIESVLIEAGYRVGRYTSPAVFEPFEVWRMNRENISLERYLECLELVKEACERMLEKGLPQPTVFEVETALAFVYFYQEKCEYVLLEVGMGGKTDATNLITKPVCSVLTSISMDHMQFLGSSLSEIARVKAGIVKEGCPVVTAGKQNPEVLQILRDVTAERNAKLIVTDDAENVNVMAGIGGIDYKHKKAGKIHLSMPALYQIENSDLAITVCMEVLNIPADIIRKGIDKAKWPGRFEQISRSPLVVIDGAHNEDAAKKLAEVVRNYFTKQRITYIIGVLADKEHAKMLELMLPYAHRIYTVTPLNKRALDGAVLAEEVRSFGKEAVYCKSIREAAVSAVKDARMGETEIIVAFGSLSYLAELKEAVDYAKKKEL